MKSHPIFIKVSRAEDKEETIQFINIDQIARFGYREETNMWIIKAKNCFMSNDSRKLSSYVVHPDSNKTIKKIIQDSINYGECKGEPLEKLIEDLINELQYNPNIGSKISEAKDRFAENLKILFGKSE